MAISNYSSGDAKWLFSPVAITPNASYQFSDWYQSTVATEVDLEYTDSAGTVYWVGLGSIPASSSWKQFTANFTTPSYAKTLSVMHILATNGQLTTDNYSLIPSVNLYDPHKKEIAQELVSSAENSSLNWRAQYAYIQDIGDGRGYTAGIIGFCSGTGDMLDLVTYYDQIKPNNILTKYLPALRSVNGTSSHIGLDPTFVGDWQTAATDPVFQGAQDHERDRVYFNPSVNLGIADGLHALGQFAYYDATVMHGYDGMSAIRATAMSKAKTPAQGGNETTYLNAFLDARKAAMLAEPAHTNTDRVDTEQRKFLNEGNLDLNPPLSWTVYGDPYTILN
ncbi:MAG: hypothetical protein NVSMB39_4150 [Candidatus Saccharimonadales bacterium]